jgi:hypothetical protein
MMVYGGVKVQRREIFIALPNIRTQFLGCPAPLSSHCAESVVIALLMGKKEIKRKVTLSIYMP